MINLRGSFALRVTICSVIALVLLAGAASYGFSNQLLAHGPYPPPDDPAVGSMFLAHGPYPPPDDPAVGSMFFKHGPYPPPDDPAVGSM